MAKLKSTRIFGDLIVDGTITGELPSQTIENVVIHGDSILEDVQVENNFFEQLGRKVDHYKFDDEFIEVAMPDFLVNLEEVKEDVISVENRATVLEQKVLRLESSSSEGAAFNDKLAADINNINFELKINKIIANSDLKTMFVDEFTTPDSLEIVHGVFEEGRVLAKKLERRRING